MLLSGHGMVSDEIIREAVQQVQTPFYLYDESVIISKCLEVLDMPNAFGLRVGYAMKANSNKAILQLVHQLGFYIDASSLNEARRAHLAGIPLQHIMLTTQEVPRGDDRRQLEDFMSKGLKYNVCSLLQLELIADFAAQRQIPLSIRVHPGVGTGESQTRNTGDHYSCFGVHLSDIEKALYFAAEKKLKFTSVHTHIGSGGDPMEWRDNIDRELGFVHKYFPDATTVNLGGGFKEARMPDETGSDIYDLGLYAKDRFEKFEKKNGRKLVMAVEPGTYLVANSGYLVCTVLDKKQTGPTGFEFLVLDGGMESNARPLLYGSRHPFYVVSRAGKLLSSEYNLQRLDPEEDLRVVVGRCCESGDSQSLDREGNIIPRVMANPEVGDYVIIGGTGAYCSAMSPHNYNSYIQSPELLLRHDGTLQIIRKPQTVEQMVMNELPL